jgi:integrase
MPEYTVGYALRHWDKSPEAAQVGKAVKKCLKTALKKYVIPELDKSVESLTPRKFAQYCESLPIEELKNALSLFDQAFDTAVKAEKLSESTKRNYRSALGRFMDWVERQIWWKEIFIEDSLPKTAPRRPKSPPKIKTGRPRQEHIYRLPEDQLPEFLKEQIKDYEYFRLKGRNKLLTRQERRQDFRPPKIQTIEQSTFEVERELLFEFFGWCSTTDHPVCLESLLDSDIIDDFNNWLIGVRGNSHSVGIRAASLGIAVAKFLNQTISRRRNWSDIEIIQELRDLRSEYEEEYDKEKKININKKWPGKKITHEQARQIVYYLREWCSSNYSDDTKRDLSPIIRAWQCYLIVKILVYCPVRQQEIRQLEYNKTLFRELDEQKNPYYYALVKGKDFSRTGICRRYKLPSVLTEDLDTWINVWHPKIREAVETPESWLNFRGWSLQKLNQAKVYLEEAKNGQIRKDPRAGGKNYIKNLENIVTSKENFLKAREVVKQNLAEHNLLFISFGATRSEAFGRQLLTESISTMVTGAVGRASLALFGEQKTTNPHAFRHIGEKHIRKIRPADKAAFGRLIGHSEQEGDEYAGQITTDYELTEPIVDNWWEED